MLALLLSSRAAAAGHSAEASARASFQKACALDLGGHEERFDYAKWTAASDDPERGVFLASWNEFVIVTECRIETVTVKDKQGKARIVCRRIGSSPGKAVIREESPVSESVSLSLRQDGGQWWITDPPPPRVHVDALIESFRRELAAFKPGWEQGATEARKRIHQQYLDALGELMRIRTKTLGGGQVSSRSECGT
jgi:hypothetical protein